MNVARDPETLRARVRAPEEEIRYRAAGELDAAGDEQRELLLALLGDPSWRVRSAAVARIVTTGAAADVLPPLLGALSGGGNVGIRDAAAVALARVGAPAVLPLLSRLDGPDPDLRQAAAHVLGAIGDRRAVAPLAARLADPDPNVRAAAAESLGKIGGPEAGATLLAALDSDEHTLRLAAVESLLAMRVCPPAARLEPLLVDRAVRRPVYRILGFCDEPEAAALLARGLAEGSRGARESALAGIGTQRTRRSAAELQQLAAAVREVARAGHGVEACSEALAAEDVSVAVGALSVLGWAGLVGQVAAMLRLAENDRLRPFLEESLESLPKGRPLRDALAAALEEQGPFGRIAALALLSRLGSPAALEALVREASDPSGYLQAEAISALGLLGDARAVGPLAGLLGDDAPAVSGIAATALVRIGQESAEAGAAALSSLRDRFSSSPSASLLRVLGALGSAEDLPRLRIGLSRPAMVQRMAAAGAISSLAQRGIVVGGEVPELVGALSDASWSVRASAARAFVELARAGVAPRRRDPPEPGSPLSTDAVAALTRSLDDPEAAVRAAAVEALGATGQAEQVEPIAALARAPDVPPVVVLAALRALAALGKAPADVIARRGSRRSRGGEGGAGSGRPPARSGGRSAPPPRRREPALGRAPGGGTRDARARRSRAPADRGGAGRPRDRSAGGPRLRRGRPGSLRRMISWETRTRKPWR